MKKSIITKERKAKFSAEANEDWENMHESNWASIESTIQNMEEYLHFFKNFELGKDEYSTLIHYRNRMRDLAKHLNSDGRMAESELDYFDCRFD